MDDMERNALPEEEVTLLEDCAEDAIDEDAEPCDCACEDTGEEAEAEEALAETDAEVAEDAEDYPEEDKPIKGPRPLAWLAAIFVMIIGLAAVIPAGLNGLLGIFALEGLIYEAAGMGQSAYAAYEVLTEKEQTASEFAEENFSFTDSEAPAISTGTFWTERALMINYKMYGPMIIFDYQYNPYTEWFAELEGKTLPRGLKQVKFSTDAVEYILNAFFEKVYSEDAAELSYSEMIELVREEDPDKEARKLQYDAVALAVSSAEELKSEEAGERIAALKAAPGSERWMYADLEFYLAKERLDYETLLALCDERLAASREDVTGMEYKVKALYLSGQTEQAFRAAEKYQKQELARDYMLLVRADLYNREGDYSKAIALSDEIIATLDKETYSNGGVVMEATANKAIAMLLEDKAEEAYTLLMETFQAGYGNTSNNYASALFASAILTENEAYLEELYALAGMDESTLPQAFIDLKAGETTAEEIFTVGWGGAAV